MRILAAALLVLAVSCSAKAATPRTLTIDGAWARASVPGALDGVVYLSVTSPVTDLLLNATVPGSIAAKVELHESMGGDGGTAMANMPEMTKANGTMTMMPLPGVDLPEGKTVKFQPGAKHLVLKSLATPLAAGSSFPLTIKTVRGEVKEITVVVSDNAP
jgi:periplasmic copper chaperone A